MKVKTQHNALLEDTPLDPSALSSALAVQKGNLDTARRLVQEAQNPEAPGILGRELVRIAQLQTLAGEHTQALENLREVCELWASLGRPRARWMARLHMGKTLRQDGQHAEALEVFSSLHQETNHPETAMYLGFALPQRGITLWQMGRRDEAVADLEETLRIRKERGAARMIREAEALLKAIRETNPPLSSGSV